MELVKQEKQRSNYRKEDLRPLLQGYATLSKHVQPPKRAVQFVQGRPLSVVGFGFKQHYVV